MTNEEKKQAVLNSDSVQSYKEWKTGNMDRTYLTLTGYDSSFHGCRTTKVFWDNKADRLVVQTGKGIAKSDFLDSVEAIKQIAE